MQCFDKQKPHHDIHDIMPNDVMRQMEIDLLDFSSQRSGNLCSLLRVSRKVLQTAHRLLSVLNSFNIPCINQTCFLHPLLHVYD